jgi:hypothetical protein
MPQCNKCQTNKVAETRGDRWRFIRERRVYLKYAKMVFSCVRICVRKTFPNLLKLKKIRKLKSFRALSVKLFVYELLL